MRARNIVAARYADRSTAYDAFSKIKQADEDDRLTVHRLVALERDSDGRLMVSDGSGTDGAGNALVDGVIGTLVGVLGTPLGRLLGDDGDGDARESSDGSPSALRRLAQIVADGGWAFVTDVTEPSTEIIDDALGPLGGSLVRFPVGEVEAEAKASDDARAAARRAADRALRSARPLIG